MYRYASGNNTKSGSGYASLPGYGDEPRTSPERMEDLRKASSSFPVYARIIAAVLGFMTVLMLVYVPLSITLIVDSRARIDKLLAAPTISISTHTMSFILGDLYGYTIPETEFSTPVEVLRVGNDVTVRFPQLNFQVPPPGGFLYSTTHDIPEELYPADSATTAVVGSMNFVYPWNYSIDTEETKVGKIVHQYAAAMGVAGDLSIYAPSNPSGVMLEGPQVLQHFQLSYRLRDIPVMRDNVKISDGSTNTATFYRASSRKNGVRDLHVNSAHGRVVCVAWVDNSRVENKTQSILNTYAKVGWRNDNGAVEWGPTIELTDYTSDGEFSWDTATTVNPTDKNNIVVSSLFIQVGYNSTMYRAVTFDGGKTWPDEYRGWNGQLTTPTVDIGDNRGVIADKYGNVWYVTSTRKREYPANSGLYYSANPTVLYLSTDGGITYENAFTITDYVPNDQGMHDFGQVCLGADENGQYGIWILTDYFVNAKNDPNGLSGIVPYNGFLPILGLGDYDVDSYTFSFLSEFVNTQMQPTCIATEDGKMWTYSVSFGQYGALASMNIKYKSPGPINTDYAGPYDVARVLNANYFINYLEIYKSQPSYGFFPTSQGIIYDRHTKALYVIVCDAYPSWVMPASQNMILYLKASRNNGQTWTRIMDISNTKLGNRGFASMAFDDVTGDLHVAWYDGRNDPNRTTLDYYAGMVTAGELSTLVKHIPASNPVNIYGVRNDQGFDVDPDAI